MVKTGGGKFKLVERKDLPEQMPVREGTPIVWILAQYLIKALETKSIEGAAQMWHKAGASAELARDLAYRLYTMCEKKKLSKEAAAYNELVIAWPDIISRAQELKQPTGQGQGKLF